MQIFMTFSLKSGMVKVYVFFETLRIPRKLFMGLSCDRLPYCSKGNQAEFLRTKFCKRQIFKAFSLKSCTVKANVLFQTLHNPRKLFMGLFRDRPLPYCSKGNLAKFFRNKFCKSACSFTDASHSSKIVHGFVSWPPLPYCSKGNLAEFLRTKFWKRQMFMTFSLKSCGESSF